MNAFRAATYDVVTSENDDGEILDESVTEDGIIVA